MARIPRTLAALLGSALLVAALAPTAFAGEPRVRVVADGLDNPRGMAIGPDGALYVAEAGTGGTLHCYPGPEGESCGGLTGAITRVGKHSQRRVVRGLPSFAAPDGSGATGPSDIAFRGRTAFVPLNLGGDPAIRATFPKALRKTGWLAAFRVGSRNVRLVKDLAGFEARRDPDGQGPDSNPYSLVANRKSVVVADAGANALLRVGPYGRTTVLATFPDVMVPAPPFLGLPPGTLIPADAVPNTVVKGPDGAYYVGTLTGFPFHPGSASVYRVVPGKAPKVYASGFTNIIDMAFTKRGDLLVLEIAANGLLSGDPAGRLARVRKGVTTTLLTEGLVSPGGLLVGRKGEIYISNFGTSPDAGQILKVTF